MVRATTFFSFFLLTFSGFSFSNNFSAKLLAGLFQLPEATYSDDGYRKFQDDASTYGVMLNYQFTNKWSVDLGYINVGVESGEQCSGNYTNFAEQCTNWDRSLSQVILAPRYQHDFSSKRGYFGFKAGAAFSKYDATYESINYVAPYAAFEVGFNVLPRTSIGFGFSVTSLEDLNGDSNSSTGANGFISVSF